jgi:hypothetical protein
MTTLICLFSDTALVTLPGILTIVMLIYQQYRTKKVTRANFWLKLEETFSTGSRERVHMKIMDKKYPQDNFIATDDSYWLDDYLGIFEFCFLMIEQRVINIETFKAIYRYRLIYFLQYELLVKEKLIKEGYYYEYLYKLFYKWSDEKKWIEFWEQKIEKRTREELKNEEYNNSLYKELKLELIVPLLRKEKVSTEIDNIVHW